MASKTTWTCDCGCDAQTVDRDADGWVTISLHGAPVPAFTTLHLASGCWQQPARLLAAIGSATATAQEQLAPCAVTIKP